MDEEDRRYEFLRALEDTDRLLRKPVNDSLTGRFAVAQFDNFPRDIFPSPSVGEVGTVYSRFCWSLADGTLAVDKVRMPLVEDEVLTKFSTLANQVHSPVIIRSERHHRRR